MLDIQSILENWQTDPEFAGSIASCKTIPASKGELRDLPTDITPALREALISKGVTSLYSHQADAFHLLAEGKSVVVSTGTASGKTLCYNLPVLEAMLRNTAATALYLFPTKALEQDQLKGLHTLLEALGAENDLPCAVYDGDTPAHHRQEIRKKASILITNPDMLHQAILPHHTLWHKFFRNLSFVVIDEIHIYRGVFGSHIANVIRRLKRIANFYGSWPRFILTSATIGNPLELGEKLVDSPLTLIDRDGSPHGKRFFLIYNPPLIDEQLGLRKSAIQAGINLGRKLLLAGRQSLIFARTRRTVEMILMYMMDQLPEAYRGLVRGYRSGYLKTDRRQIEQDLKSGAVRTVVATSALELGIDIGDLESVILVGYPGSVATTLQRAGRAGRQLQTSLAIMVTAPDAMDKYLAHHPEYLTEGNPENALINPDNLPILLQHLQCAAFELGFTQGDTFGSLEPGLLENFLKMFANSGLLNQQNDRYFWLGEQFPAAEVSLRSSTPSRISLKSTTDEGEELIGEIDAGSAAWLVHPEAVYLHEAETYTVKDLDLEHGLCLLEKGQTDYYTMPTLETTIENFASHQGEVFGTFSRDFGDLRLRIEVTGYRKLRWLTNETIGNGTVSLPPRYLETQGAWFGIQSNLVQDLKAVDLWSGLPNNYGPLWPNLRKKILERDGFRCRGCGGLFDPSKLHVHHIKPFKTFTNPEQANMPSNLVTLCPACHQMAEESVRVRSGLAGACNALRNLAPLLVMCDREDLAVLSDPKSPLTGGLPTILVYDSAPGGMGLSQKLYETHGAWIRHAAEMITECPCQDGCPACVGPIGEEGFGGKVEALALLLGMGN
ncbi:MAG: DEAD/DEAH box helicase [Anaerolineaceae bacterium]|nr:DEAD/DEAH box helicase [Anaerolineaceae bacterium]